MIALEYRVQSTDSIACTLLKLNLEHYINLYSVLFFLSSIYYEI